MIMYKLMLTCLLFFILSLRKVLKEYRKAKEWMALHEIDVSYYEKQKLKKKETSVWGWGFAVYYVGYLGRRLAYGSRIRN